jgi:hypothetical protein
MSNTLIHVPTNKRRFLLALAGLVIAVVSPIFWALTLDSNFLQRTALMMWIGMALGFVCAALAALKDYRKPTRIVALLTGFWILLSVPGYLVFTKLPAPAGFGLHAQVAEFTLPNHLGEQTSLSGLLRENMVLLVFYRGHW